MYYRELCKFKMNDFFSNAKSMDWMGLDCNRDPKKRRFWSFAPCNDITILNKTYRENKEKLFNQNSLFLEDIVVKFRSNYNRNDIACVAGYC